jgi:hypothetical protein
VCVCSCVCTYLFLSVFVCTPSVRTYKQHTYARTYPRHTHAHIQRMDTHAWTHILSQGAYSISRRMINVVALVVVVLCGALQCFAVLCTSLMHLSCCAWAILICKSPVSRMYLSHSATCQEVSDERSILCCGLLTLVSAIRTPCVSAFLFVLACVCSHQLCLPRRTRTVLGILLVVSGVTMVLQ